MTAPTPTPRLLRHKVCSRQLDAQVHGHPAGSERFRPLPAAGGTDGTGYWTITIHALGYADTVVKFQTTAENLAKHELASDADRAALQAVVATAQSKTKAAYTAASYADLETELAESVELLSRDTLYKAAALEQVTHLTDAVQNLKAA